MYQRSSGYKSFKASEKNGSANAKKDVKIFDFMDMLTKSEKEGKEVTIVNEEGDIVFTPEIHDDLMERLNIKIVKYKNPKMESSTDLINIEFKYNKNDEKGGMFHGEFTCPYVGFFPRETTFNGKLINEKVSQRMKLNVILNANEPVHKIIMAYCNLIESYMAKPEVYKKLSLPYRKNSGKEAANTFNPLIKKMTNKETGEVSFIAGFKFELGYDNSKNVPNDVKTRITIIDNDNKKVLSLNGCENEIDNDILEDEGADLHELLKWENLLHKNFPNKSEIKLTFSLGKMWSMGGQYGIPMISNYITLTRGKYETSGREASIYDIDNPHFKKTETETETETEVEKKTEDKTKTNNDDDDENEKENDEKENNEEENDEKENDKKENDENKVARKEKKKKENREKIDKKKGKNKTAKVSSDEQNNSETSLDEASDDENF